MSVQVLDGVAAQWQEYVGDDVPIHASAPWLGASSHRLPPVRFTFLTTEKGERGGVLGGVIDDPDANELLSLYGLLLADPKVWKFPAANLAARPGLRAQVAPPQEWLPHLVVIYPGFDSFVAASGGPSAELAGTLIDGVVSWAAGQEMKAVSLHYVRADTVLPEVLTDRGFRRVPLTFRSRLTVGRGFEEYLASFPRKRRMRMAAERQYLADAGIRTVRSSFEDKWPDILALRCGLVEKYGQKPNEELETMNLRRLYDRFGEDRTRLYCSFLDDRLVGFTLYAIWRDSWYSAYTGTKVSPATRGVYFEHHFYTPIAEASTEGAREVDFGIGAWEGKRRRGAELTPVDLWVRALDPVVEQAIDVAGAAMLREEGWVRQPGNDAVG